MRGASALRSLIACAIRFCGETAERRGAGNMVTQELAGRDVGNTVLRGEQADGEQGER